MLKKILLALAMTFSWIPAHAKAPNWYKIVDLDGSSLYVDVNNITFNNNRIMRLWVLKDIADPKNPITSLKVFHEFDCVSSQEAAIKYYMYSGHMGNGDVLLTTSDDPKKINPIVPGSFMDAIKDRFCP